MRVNGWVTASVQCVSSGRGDQATAPWCITSELWLLMNYDKVLYEFLFLTDSKKQEWGYCITGAADVKGGNK